MSDIKGSDSKQGDKGSKFVVEEKEELLIELVLFKLLEEMIKQEFKEFK